MARFYMSEPHWMGVELRRSSMLSGDQKNRHLFDTGLRGHAAFAGARSWRNGTLRGWSACQSPEEHAILLFPAPLSQSLAGDKGGAPK
jgi:hypothetical protein